MNENELDTDIEMQRVVGGGGGPRGTAVWEVIVGQNKKRKSTEKISG